MDSNTNLNSEVINKEDEGVMQVSRTPSFAKEEYEKKYSGDKEAKETRIRFGKILLIPTMLFALFTAYCEYDTYSMAGFSHCGLTALLITLASIIQFFVTMKLTGKKVKTSNVFYVLAMVLLAIATFLSDDGLMASINKYAIVVLNVDLLINAFTENGAMGIAEHIIAWFRTVFGGLNRFTVAAKDMGAIKSESKSEFDKSVLLKVLTGVGISIPLLTVIIIMLCSADAVFASILKDYQPDFELGHFVSIVFIATLTFFTVYAVYRYLLSGNLKDVTCKPKQHSAVIAITVGTLISIVYGAFSIIQVVYLFGKHSLPAGYTYASYAKEGVFQLMWLSIINLILVLLGVVLFEKSNILKFILTFISACTYMMIASSSYRLWQYVNICHGLTRKRIFGIWGLLTVSVCFVGMIIFIYKDDFKLHRFGLTTILTTYIILALLKPDYLIAKINVDILPSVIESTCDTDLLERLGFDALPVMKEYDSEWIVRQGNTEFERYNSGKNNKSGWKQINLSRSLAESEYYKKTQK